jgi:serine/threonine protein kinase
MPKHNRSSGSSVRQSKMRKEEDSLCHQCTPIDGDMGNDIKSSTDDLQINATCNSYFEDNGFLYLVQQFIKGENLLDELEQKGKYNENQIRELLLDLLPSLKLSNNGIL